MPHAAAASSNPTPKNEEISATATPHAFAGRSQRSIVAVDRLGGASAWCGLITDIFNSAIGGGNVESVCVQDPPYLRCIKRRPPIGSQRAGGRLVSGTHGVGTACARQPLDPL
jgi:hypothetical protein